MYQVNLCVVENIYFSTKKVIKVLYFLRNMLTSDIANQINNFVAQKPRTIQDIAQLIGKNWRTAQSYVAQIAQEQGTIATTTFRAGTKGGLKIVYWNLINKNQSTFQEMLFARICSARHKSDFSPFDIYQYVEDAKRECFLEKQEHNLNVKQDLISTIASAQEQVLIFSGDVSWAQATQQDTPLIYAFELLCQKKVPIKMVTNVDLNSVHNVTQMLNLNHKYGKNLIEIRHCHQPLRAFVVDGTLARCKEKYFLKTTAQENYLFYSITDSDWVGWFKKVFWHFFSTSISAEKRIQDLETIRKM